MKRAATRLSLALCLWAAAVLALSAPASGAPRETGPGAPPLTMEELVVRGIREKPEALFVPVPGAIFSPAPARFDLFLEDLTKPILPADIPLLEPKGGHRGTENAAD